MAASATTTIASIDIGAFFSELNISRNLPSRRIRITSKLAARGTRVTVPTVLFSHTVGTDFPSSGLFQARQFGDPKVPVLGVATPPAGQFAYVVAAGQHFELRYVPTRRGVGHAGIVGDLAFRAVVRQPAQQLELCVGEAVPIDISMPVLQFLVPPFRERETAPALPRPIGRYTYAGLIQADFRKISTAPRPGATRPSWARARGSGLGCRSDSVRLRMRQS